MSYSSNLIEININLNRINLGLFDKNNKRFYYFDDSTNLAIRHAKIPTFKDKELIELKPLLNKLAKDTLGTNCSIDAYALPDNVGNRVYIYKTKIYLYCIIYNPLLKEA